jgi:uncharacterized membrane protein
MADIGLLADPALYGAEAAGINDAGQAVGRAWNANYQRVFLWTPQQPNGTAGAMADLNNPVGDYDNHGAAAVNASGQVAGTNYANTVNPQPFLWSPQQPNGSAGALAPIGPPLERATAMNAAGQVVGYAGYDAAAALFTPASPNGSTGTVARLALPAGYFGSTALGMNDAGVVVGSARFDGGPDAAFVWTPDAANGTTGAATLLPRVAAGPASSSANDVNNRGDAVGRSAGLTTYSGEGAVLWPAGGGVVDLNAALDVPLPAGWSLLEAVAINDLGQVVANGAYWDGDPGSRPTFRAFLLTPVPEPAAPLGAAALCGYGMLRRRRGRPPSTSARLVIYSKFETTCGSRRIVRSSAPP